MTTPTPEALTIGPTEHMGEDLWLREIRVAGVTLYVEPAEADAAQRLLAALARIEDAAPVIAFPSGGRTLRISARSIWSMGLAGCSVRLGRVNDYTPTETDR